MILLIVDRLVDIVHFWVIPDHLGQ